MTDHPAADAELQRCRAMIDGDLQALDRLLDPRLSFSHATGAVDDKPTYMAKMAAGRIAYRSIDWSEQLVVSLDGAALVSGRMTSAVEVEGVAKRLDNRVLAVWTLSDAWRLVAFQSTPLVGG